jgi:hypothetical protein
MVSGLVGAAVALCPPGRRAVAISPRAAMAAGRYDRVLVDGRGRLGCSLSSRGCGAYRGTRRSGYQEPTIVVRLSRVETRTAAPTVDTHPMTVAAVPPSDRGGRADGQRCRRTVRVIDLLRHELPGDHGADNGRHRQAGRSEHDQDPRVQPPTQTLPAAVDHSRSTSSSEAGDRTIFVIAERGACSCPVGEPSRGTFTDQSTPSMSGGPSYTGWSGCVGGGLR